MRKASSIHADIAAYKIQQAEKWQHSDLMVVQGLVNTYEVRPLLQALAAVRGAQMGKARQLLRHIAGLLR